MATIEIDGVMLTTSEVGGGTAHLFNMGNKPHESIKQFFTHSSSHGGYGFTNFYRPITAIELCALANIWHDRAEIKVSGEKEVWQGMTNSPRDGELCRDYESHVYYIYSATHIESYA